jgi:dipeptidyl aminopeptidase/acylaminoacyl peptidase
VLKVSGPEEPSVYYLFDVKAHNIESLANAMPRFNTETLGPMRRFDYTARDGAALFAYVTEPPHAGPGPLPLVVLPHGGPEVSDHFEYDTWVQYLATRGYVVLQPIFRGSGGYGRKFAEAGYGEWGGRMHDDVADAAKALIASGRIDASKVCVAGVSYGGYEALWSAHAQPDLYKCAISVAGLSDLKTDMNWERHYGTDSFVYKYWLRAMGDPKTEADKLVARSPVTHVKTWTVPVLLIHGDKDDNVDIAQARIMKRALEAEHKPVRYVEIKGMGHGPGTDEEWTRVLTEMDSFLAIYLRPAAAPLAKPATAAPAP